MKRGINKRSTHGYDPRFSSNVPESDKAEYNLGNAHICLSLPVKPILI